MRYQTTEFKEVSITETSRVSQHIFEYSPHLKFKSLQKLCFWVLGKLKCFSTIYEPKISAVTISHRTFTANLLAQYGEIMERCRYNPKCVYMGVNQFNLLAEQSAELNTDMNAVVRLEVGSNGQKYILGLDIHIVPWLDGVFIAPERY